MRAGARSERGCATHSSTARQLDQLMAPAAADRRSAVQVTDQQLPHTSPACTDVYKLQDQRVLTHSAADHSAEGSQFNKDVAHQALPISTAAESEADLDAVPSRSSRLDQQRPHAAVGAAEAAPAAPGYIAITVKVDRAPSADRSVRQLQQCASNLSTVSQSGIRECRICLAADNQEDLVQPCNCTGSVKYAHMECLKAWVQERCSLQVRAGIQGRMACAWLSLEHRL